MRIEPITRISKGDTANTLRYILPNHTGTHVDVPKHFFDEGPTLTDFAPEFWIFENPLLIDVPCDDDYLIEPEHISGAINQKADILFLTSRFERYREESRYWMRNPGLSPSLGTWIREKFLNIRAIGVDFISVTSQRHKNEGRLAHRAFLDPKGLGKAVVIIEDMSLCRIDGTLTRVIVMPLRVSGSDGGPCTVVGYME